MSIVMKSPPLEGARIKTEDELLALSGLQHLAYCPRQWALIYIEKIWEENLFTTEGKILHRHAHEEGTEKRAGVHIARGLRIRSLELGVFGITDIVEFKTDPQGIKLSGQRGRWRPYPVEYKRGRPKKGCFDEVQLCAQAFCLEEMLGISIVDGAIYYGKAHHRHLVTFDKLLRERTVALAKEMHRLWEIGVTPEAKSGPKCDDCSLAARCLPTVTNRSACATLYLERLFTPPGADSNCEKTP
ncbi:CRISPR-associated exonuclease Cas4 [Gammaproteobacteria bacterium]